MQTSLAEIPKHKINRMMVGIDPDSEKARDLLSLSVSFAKLLGGHLHVVSVVQSQVYPMSETAGAYFAMPTYDQKAMSTLEEGQINEHRDRVAALLNGLDADEHVTMEIVIGPPESMLAEFADEKDIDLVIVGHHQRNWFDKLFDPSTSHALIDQTNCALLILPDDYV